MKGKQGIFDSTELAFQRCLRTYRNEVSNGRDNSTKQNVKPTSQLWEWIWSCFFIICSWFFEEVVIDDLSDCIFAWVNMKIKSIPWAYMSQVAIEVERILV